VTDRHTNRHSMTVKAALDASIARQKIIFELFVPF